MADHYRKQIRDAVVAAVTGLTTTGARVYPSHPYAIDLAKEGGPTLLIYTIDEDSSRHAMKGGHVRSLRVAVEAMLLHNTTADDTIDQIAKEVETAMGAGLGLGQRVGLPTLVRTQVAFRKEGEKVIGGAVMTFEVNYITPNADPST